MAPRLIFDAHHADYLVRLLSENLSNDEMATRLSKQFRVRITAGQVGTLLARMRRPTDAIYRLPVSQSGQPLQRLKRSYPPSHRSRVS